MYCKKFVKKKQMNTKLTVKIYASFNTDFYRSEKNQLFASINIPKFKNLLENYWSTQKN